ncbi:conserved hypothetical protein [Thermosulfidibacter takaii ABI70S6]|uniref:N-acetyltransferase domain-containing protein n=1 Tax=Thermosulfidibacter takaii (strain DSM 17441 / JCM 13301 / NBRC 103674 / ABI70S6) TaxID=1298851 RepID=A0A0S3QR94_THET7|nr:GNAT family N-acetyltransferase [Thermosulfidibacter takaii]BAT70839.1 conserved hypothetical protein [Thermosulfidibacter takaii ABI70S6]
MIEEKTKADFKIERLKNLEEVIDQLLDLYKKAYIGMEEYAYTADSSLKRYLRWLFRHDPNGFFVAKDPSGKIVAFIATDANWINRGRKVGEIHELVVDPEMRGKGLAVALINRAIEYFKSKGLKITGLWVGEKNKGAQKLYEKLGYKPLYTKGIWVRMEREL